MRIFLLFFSVLFGTSVFAQEYYWYLGSYAPSPNSFPTPTAACQGMDTSSLEASGWTVVFDRLEQLSVIEYRCWHKASKDGYNGGLPVDRNYTSAKRAGTACPADTEYNAATGLCDPVETSACESTIGNAVEHQVKVADILADGSQGNFQQPPSAICDNSCEYTTPANEECYRFASGDPAGVFCKYQYRGTGTSCSSGEPAASPAPRSPTQFEDSSCTGTTVDANGFSVWDCTSTSSFTDPGNMTCGAANGEVKCYAKSPIPESTSAQTDTNYKEKTNADGSKDTTATTTETKTTCSGVGACSTTTSTTTTNQHTNPDGSPGAESSTCEGSGCKPEEEEPEPSSVSGEDCGVPVVCEGDAVACATLRQAKEQNCLLQEQTDYESVKTDIDNLFTGPEFHADPDTEIQVPNFINEGARFLTPSCPPAEVFAVGGRSFALEYTPLCNAAEAISPLLIIMAALSAALYIGKAFGGA